MASKEIFGGESSSSDSSEESSSEEDPQKQQSGEAPGQSSSSSESGDDSGSDGGQDEEVKGQGSPMDAETTPVLPNTQDLFGGDSSSESSSESEDGGRGRGVAVGTGSPTGSGTPEAPEVSPLGGSLGGSPKEGGAQQRQMLEGIFGDAADLSSSDDDAIPAAGVRKEMRADFDRDDVDDDDDDVGFGMEGEGQEEVMEEEEAPRINVDIPRCVAQLGSELYFVKLPNFLSVETRPFNHELYEDEGEDDDILDEEGRARLKLKVENTIRWRYSQDEDGNEMRESNARVVRWTDGTMSLYLGSEIFDINKQPLQGEYSHLFVRQGTGLQGQSVFRNKLSIRPHSTDSQTHRKMTLSIADRFSKAQKIRVLPVAGKDPESQRSERIKKEEENLRAAIRKDHQKRRVRESNAQRGLLTASYLEPGRDQDLEEDISAIKSSVRSRVGGASRRGGRGYESEESSEEEEEEEAHERLMRAKDSEKSDVVSSAESKRQTRGSSAKAKGGGSRKVTKSRKLVFSSDEDSD